jgi:hypothetical protein
VLYSIIQKETTTQQLDKVLYSIIHLDLTNNIAFGQNAGCLFSGSSSNNIAIGFAAGPSTLTQESNKLYIASGSGTPLIKGDFAAKTVNISGSLIATSFTGSLLGTASFATQSICNHSFILWRKCYIGILCRKSNIQGGDTNYIPIWNTATSLSSSIIYQSGSNIGIGTTSPAYKLSVVGKIALNDGGDSIFIGTNAGLVDDATSNNNLGIGINALISNTTGNQNVAVGNNSLITNIIGTDNTAIGKNTLQFNLASTNTAVGSYSQASASLGTFNNSIGTNSLFANSVGNFNVALGSSTLRLNTSGSNNTAVGTSTLFNNVTGSENTAIGSNAGRYFGSGTSANVDPSASVFIGRNTRANASGETNQIVIGMNALGLGSNTVVLGNDNIITTVLKGNVGIGTTTPNAKLDVSGSVNISGSGTQIPLQVSSGSTSLLFVSGSGNVGIGTTTPGKLLEVKSSTAYNSTVRLSYYSP